MLYLKLLKVHFFNFNYNFEDILDKEFAKENLDKLSQEEIISIIEKCRKVSLWNRFFGGYEQFKDFERKIEYLQPIEIL